MWGNLNRSGPISRFNDRKTLFVDRGGPMSDAAFWLFVLACLVLFAGTPDLHDALIAHVGVCK